MNYDQIDVLDKGHWAARRHRGLRLAHGCQIFVIGVAVAAWPSRRRA
jgi:hypothetical protein